MFTVTGTGSGAAGVCCKSSVSRTSERFPFTTRKASFNAIARFKVMLPPTPSNRTRTFCGNAASWLAILAHRESAGPQLLRCKSEAIQISEVPALFSISHATAVCINPAMSVAVSVAAIAGILSNDSAPAKSCAAFVALSSNTRWLLSANGLAACVNNRNASSRFVRFEPAACVSMLADRSSKMRMASGAGESAQPIQPPASGRARKSTNISTASTRNSRINHCRNWRGSPNCASRKPETASPPMAADDGASD